MAFGERGEWAAQRIAMRVSGEAQGKPIAKLCTATIRAVAQGVIGIAFIQMLLIGVGFVIKGCQAQASWPSPSSCWVLPRRLRR